MLARFSFALMLAFAICVMSAGAAEPIRLHPDYGNQGHPIRKVNPRISILNFHYAWPDAARWNYGWDRVIGFDESGFAGSDDDVYRVQAWRFMLSGGGLFNNLDYSFYVGHEDGSGSRRGLAQSAG